MSRPIQSICPERYGQNVRMEQRKEPKEIYIIIIKYKNNKRQEKKIIYYYYILLLYTVKMTRWIRTK